MRYRIVVLDTGSTDVETSVRLVLSSDDAKVIKAAEVAAQASVEKRGNHAESALVEMSLVKSGPGAPGRQITIRAVEDDSPFRNLEPGDHFENAKRLSEFFKLKHNPVSVALKNAAIEDETEVTMHGITFCYTDTIKTD